MAAAEVLAFAASDGWHAAPKFSRSTCQDGTIRRRGDKQVDTRLQSRLSLISEAWVQLRSAPVSLRSYIGSCLDTTHRLFLSCREHGLDCSLIQRSGRMVRAAAVCAWCWCRSLENTSHLSRCQCQLFPVELALRLSKVHPCDWSLLKLILTDGLCSSPLARETPRPNYS